LTIFIVTKNLFNPCFFSVNPRFLGEMNISNVEVWPKSGQKLFRSEIERGLFQIIRFCLSLLIN